MPRDGRLVPSEPLEYAVIEIGEPLEANGQLSRGADRLSRLARSIRIVTTIRVWRAVVVRLLSILNVATRDPENWRRYVQQSLREAAMPAIAQDLSLNPEQIGLDRGRST